MKQARRPAKLETKSPVEISLGDFAHVRSNPCDGRVDINIKGDSRLTTRNRTYQYIYFLLSLSYFPIYYLFMFFVVDDVYCFNDGEALEWLGRLGQPIAATHPEGQVFHLNLNWDVGEINLIQ